jgi:diaminopimelate decarboxylase
VDKATFYDAVGPEGVSRLAEAQPTPCYVYFREMLRSRVAELKSCLPSPFQVHYAVKANPNPALLRELAGLGVGADVASAGELERARAAGMAPGLIEFSGPGKTEAELSEAIKQGIGSINAEGLSELRSIARISRGLGRKANVGLRINPRQAGTSAGLRMSGDTQFGMPLELAGEALGFIKQNAESLSFTGIHVHSGSQMLASAVVLENFGAVLDVALEIARLEVLPIGKINFGGGWGIKYFANQSSLDLKRLSEGLKELFADRKYASLAHVRRIVEPGRFLVGECGVYVTTVLYRKRGGEREFLIVDGGMHQNYLLAGGMGQVIRRNFELDVICRNPTAGPSGATYNIAGCLCTPQDLLATGFHTEREVQEGDRVMFFNAGAYGLTASPTGFLSHPPPAEIIL